MGFDPGFRCPQHQPGAVQKGIFRNLANAVRKDQLSQLGTAAEGTFFYGEQRRGELDPAQLCTGVKGPAGYMLQAVRKRDLLQGTIGKSASSQCPKSGGQPDVIDIPALKGFVPDLLNAFRQGEVCKAALIADDDGVIKCQKVSGVFLKAGRREHVTGDLSGRSGLTP